MKKSLQLFLFTLIALTAPLDLYGQDQDKQQAAELVEMGREMRKAALALDDIREIMVQAANLDTTSLEANLEAGILHLNTIHKDQALRYFMRIYRINPNYRTDLEYWIGMSLQFGLRFQEAIGFYERFRKRITGSQSVRTRVAVHTVDRKMEECRIGIELVARPKAYRIENMGPAVNSESDDYSPSMDSDEDFLVFTSRRKDGNINENVSLIDNKPFEDIFLSQKEKNKETWSLAKNIGSPVNTPGNDSGLGFSPDGKVLYTYARGDIYSTEQKQDGSWSVPAPLPFPINSDSTEKGFTITADGKLAIFASRRAGGIGGLDLFAVRKNQNGTWGEARNLGPAINTEYNEESPYIDPSGKVLFYSSNGKKSMGGYDVFRSILTNPAAGTWSEPENLGYPVNTPDDDLFFIGSKDEKRGYFASVREGGFGYLDIYRVYMPEFKPEQAAILPVKLAVTTKDEKSGSGITPNMTLVYANTMKTAAVPLQIGNSIVFYLRSREAQDYILTATATGYESQTVRFLMPGTTTVVQQVTRELALKPVIQNTIEPAQPKVPALTQHEQPIATAPIPKAEEKNPDVPEKTKAIETKTAERKTEPTSAGKMVRIYFSFGSANLNEDARETIEGAASRLRANPEWHVTLGGHTDNSGGEEFNLNLGQKRAESVAQALQAAGIGKSRIRIQSIGESRPIVSNDDEDEGRQINRRVEIRFIP